MLVEIDGRADRIDLGSTICVAIASDNEVVTRHTRMLGGRDGVRWKWRLTALRHPLQGLPVDERIDFEKV